MPPVGVWGKTRVRIGLVEEKTSSLLKELLSDKLAGQCYQNWSFLMAGKWCLLHNIFCWSLHLLTVRWQHKCRVKNDTFNSRAKKIIVVEWSNLYPKNVWSPISQSLKESVAKLVESSCFILAKHGRNLVFVFAKVISAKFLAVTVFAKMN